MGEQYGLRDYHVRQENGIDETEGVIVPQAKNLRGEKGKNGAWQRTKFDRLTDGKQVLTAIDSIECSKKCLRLRQPTKGERESIKDAGEFCTGAIASMMGL